jgi:hypothetical protein
MFETLGSISNKTKKNKTKKTLPKGMDTPKLMYLFNPAPNSIWHIVLSKQPVESKAKGIYIMIFYFYFLIVWWYWCLNSEPTACHQNHAPKLSLWLIFLEFKDIH